MNKGDASDYMEKHDTSDGPAKSENPTLHLGDRERVTSGRGKTDR